MKIIMDFLILLLLGVVATSTKAQSSHFSRGFYSSVATPTSHFYHHSGGFVPLTYKSDLIPEASKHRSSSKYYKKSYKGYNSDEEDTSSERYASDEYGNDSRHSLLAKDNDSHEYTIGTHIRVQHPISVPKKLKASHPTKSTKYTTLPNIGSSYSLDLSHENHGGSDFLSSPAKKQKYIKHYEPDPFHVIPPPKSTVASHHQHHLRSQLSSSVNPQYDVYEQETDSYEHPDVNLKHFKGSSQRDRYNGVASKKQIEQYLEDQEKLLDEALKLQLLSSPKFQKLLKTAEKEQLHKDVDFEDEFIANVPPPFRERFPQGGPPQSKRLRRRPPTSEFKRPSKSKPVVLSKPNRKYRQAYVIEV